MDLSPGGHGTVAAGRGTAPFCCYRAALSGLERVGGHGEFKGADLDGGSALLRIVQQGANLGVSLDSHSIALLQSWSRRPAFDRSKLFAKLAGDLLDLFQFRPSVFKCPLVYPRGLELLEQALCLQPDLAQSLFDAIVG